MKETMKRRKVKELEPLILGLRFNDQDPRTASYTCFTIRKIATTLGLSMNQVKSVLAKAKKNVRLERRENQKRQE